jgi:hypothetical protein
MANGQNREKRKITRVSGFTQIKHTIEMSIDWEDYAAWENGMLIQNAFPYLTPDEREFLMTGITAEEWNKVFAKGPGNEVEGEDGSEK